MLSRFCFAVKNRPNVYGHFSRGKTYWPGQLFDFAKLTKKKGANKSAMRAFLVQHKCVEIEQHEGWLRESKNGKTNRSHAGYDRCARNMAIYLASSGTKENIFMSYKNRMVVLLSKPIAWSDAKRDANEKNSEGMAKAYEGGLFNPQGSLGDTADRLLKSLVRECGIGIQYRGSKFITYGYVIGPRNSLFNRGSDWPKKEVFWTKKRTPELESNRKRLDKAINVFLSLENAFGYKDETQYEIVDEPSPVKTDELGVYELAYSKVMYMNFAPILESTLAAEVKMVMEGGKISKACHVKSLIIGEDRVGRIIKLSWNALGMSVGKSEGGRQVTKEFSNLKEADKPRELYVVEVHLFQLKKARENLCKDT